MLPRNENSASNTRDGISQRNFQNAIRKELSSAMSVFPGWTRANDRLSSYPERGELRLSTWRNNNSRRATGHNVFDVTPASARRTDLHLAENRGTTSSRNFSRVADHPSISTPRGPLIFVSLSIRAVLIAFARRSSKKNRLGAWNVSGKISPAGGKLTLAWPPLPKMDNAPLETRRFPGSFLRVL